MNCNICGRLNGHDPRCPDYIPKKAAHYCSVCGDGIYDGEKYIENYKNEYRHFDCSLGLKELLEWIGYEIKTMEDTYEGNHQVC